MQIGTELLQSSPSAYRQVSTLDRIRALLRVEAATFGLSSVGGAIHSGTVFTVAGLARDLELRTRASGVPLVLADVDTHATLACDKLRFVDERPIRFLAMLPVGSGDQMHLLTLADSAPRSLDVANRLAIIALEALAPRQTSHAESPLASHSQRNGQIIEQALANAHLGVWQCHLAGNTLTWSAGVFDIFGLPRGASLRRDRIVEQYTGSSRAVMEEARARAIQTGAEFKIDAEIYRADGGQKRWMRLTASVQSVNGLAVRLFGTKQDVTEERRLIDHMRHLAETDAMTGLANRARLRARLDRPEGISALLLVDLDRFKSINDTYGHATGDKCLEEAAQRLRLCCADAPLVCRLGGDEFAVVLHGDHSRADAERLAREIAEIMQAPFEHAGNRVELGASVGLAFRTHESGEELFRQADQALYAAKAAGRRTSKTFTTLRS